MCTNVAKNTLPVSTKERSPAALFEVEALMFSWKVIQYPSHCYNLTSLW